MIKIKSCEGSTSADKLRSKFQNVFVTTLQLGMATEANLSIAMYCQ